MMNDRSGFLEWIAKTFQYKESEGNGLFVQQRFVRDFLQPSSPFRGLLLFHGLGVGKSCASIAAAEVIRNGNKHRQVVVMAPASLKRSYMEELKRCGSPDFSEAAAASEENFKTRIKGSYRFISYNGITSQNVKEFTEGYANFFEGKVVVIDEAHNFVSRVVNNGILTAVYQRIMDADNCKLVLLSGTPLINSPHELAYLVNLVLGYQRIIEIKLASPISNEQLILQTISTALKQVDRSEISDDSHVLRVKLLPPGFSRKGDHGFAQYESDPDATTSVDDIIRTVRRIVMQHVQSNNNKVVKSSLAKRLLLPIDKLAFYETFLKLEEDGYKINNYDVLQKRIIGCVSFFSAYDPSLYPRVSSTHIVTVPMSARQFSEYSLKRDEERKKEETAKRFSRAKKGAAGGVDDDDSLTQTYRAYTRSICNFVFPESVPRPYRSDVRKMLDDVEPSAADPQAGSSRATDKAYAAQLNKAIEEMKTTTNALRLDQGQGNNLEQHSPKFAHIIRHLSEKKNTAVVYSSFKKVEGIGLLAAAMMANGWGQLKVQYEKAAPNEPGKGDIVFTIEGGNTMPLFMIYENEEEELSQTMLNVFNSATDKLSDTTLRSLKAALSVVGRVELDNTHGNVVQALLLTPSGAEGLNLRNVREVHLMEPFWHLNRIDQVIGRAVRARSHLALPEAERKVDIYMYLTALTPAQIKDNTSIRMQDKGVSSDQFVHNIAKRKRQLIESILEIMRRAAVDCRLHSAKHGNRVCSNTASPSSPTAPMFPLDLKEDILRSAGAQQQQARLGSMVKVNVKGTTRYLDKSTGELFDYEEHGALRKVGKIKVP